ncbi:bifunctional folylpolyglutamate synthase/dihydrofolate synthase [Roseimaritima sediminicola]|uniref:bifunctional folylpolyglutamate synthase/dihydrofolate synthase n=1 Tax=Roseimaritima sediminicola TaxID=2662066 RepID=UPI00129824AC|nr:folylpolyglutamate synthase/dihydrofolate synthase family protein [Roseimaritima sediminicola]
MGYLYGRINYERLAASAQPFPFRLKRMRGLLRQLDHPDRSLDIVHIAGTKGKGSTATMVAAMLSAGGYRTGLYTSPHLNRLGERFRVDGQPCPDADLVALVDQVRQAAERLQQEGGEGTAATFFELTTAMALVHFRTQGCRAAVLEVGLGGRLDSTNVCQPLVTAITSVGLDHQHILGHTLAEIAAEKAGIFKAGVPAISGVVDGPAAPVIARRAHQCGARLWQRGRDFDARLTGFAPHWGTRFDFVSHTVPFQQRDDWQVPLEGEHQAQNAAVALAIMDVLAQQGSLATDPTDQRRGLAAVVCPARIERLRLQAAAGGPTVLLDAAHNAESIAALCAVVRRRRSTGPVAVVFGTSHDKDPAAQLGPLLETCDHLLLTRFHGNPRWCAPAELAAVARRLAAARGNPPRPDEQDAVPAELASPCTIPPRGAAPAIRVLDDPAAALRQAAEIVSGDGMVVICGSFFLAAELRPQLVT